MNIIPFLLIYTHMHKISINKYMRNQPQWLPRKRKEDKGKEEDLVFMDILLKSLHFEPCACTTC